ncbi:MAG: hypothetical protein AAF493_20360 [Pseudomonadota bacterium]
MVNVVSPRPEIAHNLKRQVELIINSGGFIHPQLSIVADEFGNVRIDSSLPSELESICFVPNACIWCLDDFRVTLDGNTLGATPAAPGVTSLHAEMAELMIGFFNLTDKIEVTKATFPSVSLPGAPALYRHIIKQSGQFAAFKGFAESPADRQLLLTFFGSRTITLGAAETAGRQGVHPVTELANHHADAPSFRSRNYTGVGLVNWRTKGSSEVFVNYGAEDALKMLLTHGFYDTSAEFIRAVPIDVVIPNVGILKIVAESPPPGSADIHHPALADLDYWMPLVSKIDAQTLLVSHLLIPPSSCLLSLRRILEALVLTLAPRLAADAVSQAVAEIEGNVLGKTEHFYRKLTQLLATSEAQTLPASASFALKQVGRHQLKRIARYRKKVRAQPLSFLASPAPQKLA